MNHIEARVELREHPPRPRLAVYLDGMALDLLVEQLSGEKPQFGLMPIFDDSLSRVEERAIVWTRILPRVGRTTIAPVLVCASDADFCSWVVMAEVESRRDEILWRRFGFEVSPDCGVASLGSEMQWIE